jgi:hypothetical protein
MISINKYNFLLCFVLFALGSITTVSYAQKISYSSENSFDNSSIKFEVVGKQGEGYWIYKNKQRSHFLCRYNKKMELLFEKELDILPEKIIDLDIYTAKNSIMLICQFRKSQQVYCQLVLLDTAALLVQKPVVIDSTDVGSFSSNRIYSSACSDDKKKLLIYKRQIRSGILYFSAHTITSEGKITDNYISEEPFNKNQLFPGNCILSNAGDWAYLLEHRKSDEDDIYEMTLRCKRTGDSVIQSVTMPLEGNWISQPLLKSDNLNARWLVNAFYRTERRGKAVGLYTAIINRNLQQKEGYNPFINILNSADNQYAYGNIFFDNLTPAQVMVKKNGGFLLIAEDNYSETYNNQNWNRNYYYNNPYYYSNDYFYNTLPYYGYRPFGANNGFSSTRYHSGDILLLSIDSTTRLEWNNVVNKKQADNDNENFLSFGWLNAGKDIHFFFLANQNQKDIVSHQAISSTGAITRYPAWRSDKMDLQFMPRLSKQTGSGELILPFITQNKLGFALIDYAAY